MYISDNVCVYRLSWDVLMSGFPSWLSASQSTGLSCLNSFTSQVISDGTLPLLDIGAPGSHDRDWRTFSRPNWAESFRFLLSGSQSWLENWAGRGGHVGIREAGGLSHPPHPGMGHFLSSIEQRSVSILYCSCRLPILPASHYLGHNPRSSQSTLTS